MKKNITFLTLFLVLASNSKAQVVRNTRLGGMARVNNQYPLKQRLPRYHPTLNISIGYGFPNLDKFYLPEYPDLVQGDISQCGALIVSLDYQFSRRMSVGVTFTHGSVSAPYYENYSTSLQPVFTSTLDNWSLMFNLVKYLSLRKKLTPYIKTSIGINLWQQDYTSSYGNSINMPYITLPDLAYQGAVGARFNLIKKAGLFVEAGFGKYILQGGLALKF